MEKLLAFAPLLAEGAVTTIALAVLSLVLATLLGALGARAKIRRGLVGYPLAQAYTTIVRGIPDLVLILLMYFGGQRLLNAVAGMAGLEGLDISKFGAGVVAIGFIYGAYLTETFRGAWLAIPRGQGEAARALGLRGWTAFRTVLLPQLIRFAISGYGNVWQVLVKSTAVVSVIGLEDLVGLANDVGKSQREPFLFMTVVILVYLGITAVSGWGFRRLDVAFGGGGR